MRIPFANEGLPFICPKCSFEYVHPPSVRVATGQQVAITDKKGTRIVKQSTESDEAKAKRGISVLVEYGCEHGHHGNLILQFHKGQTFVLHEALPDLNHPLLILTLLDVGRASSAFEESH